MKKITAILTAAILLAAMLAACADPSKAGAKSAGAVTDTQTETAAETGLGSDTEPLEIPTQTEAAPDSTTAAQPETPPGGAGGHDPGAGARRNAQHRSSRRIQDDVCRADGEAR